VVILFSGNRGRRAHAANSSSNAFASFRSSVSNPSVNQPYTGARSSRAFLEVLIGKMGKDRDVDAVLRKCAGVLGQAEPCEPIGNFLHRRPRPAEFGLVDPT
jgi:hypothetical protein